MGTTPFRWWAFWRRVQYGTLAAFIVLAPTSWYVYQTYFNIAPTCFDGSQNGDERGIDCGGSCRVLCPADVTDLTVDWAQAFAIRPGQYNVVGYVHNQNRAAAAIDVPYTMTLLDAEGVITEVMGETVLPPDSVYPIFAGRLNTGDRVSTETRISLGTPREWISARVGREQFEVVSRNLFDTNTGRPRLEAVVKNLAYTEADEVEFVATIFDINRQPLTSSQTFVSNFASFDEERIVFTWPNPIAKTIRSCEIPTDIVVAIDLSGSMNNDQDDPPQPITSVLTAAESFVNRLEEGDQVGVVTFATQASVDVALTNSRQSAAGVISRLSIAPAEETGSTNTGDAIVRATELLTSQTSNPNARKVLVLLTDGLATAPDPDPEQYALEAMEATDAANIITYTIGLGEAVNMDFVRQLASDSARAYQAISVEEVNGIYEAITGSICESGPAIIDIIPKTENFVETTAR